MIRNLKRVLSIPAAAKLVNLLTLAAVVFRALLLAPFRRGVPGVKLLPVFKNLAVKVTLFSLSVLGVIVISLVTPLLYYSLVLYYRRNSPEPIDLSSVQGGVLLRILDFIKLVEFLRYVFRVRAWLIKLLTNTLAPWIASKSVELTFVSPILDEQPDIIHAHDLDTLSAVKTAAKLIDVPYIYDAHEIEVDRQDRRNPIARYLSGVLESNGIKRASGVVTITEQAAKFLADRYALADVTVVYNSPVTTVEAASDVRSDIGIDSNSPLFLYVGKVTIGRGLDLLVKVLPLLPGCHIATVGHNVSWVAEELDVIAKELGIADRFHQLPPVSPHMVASYIRTANIGVIPVPCVSSNQHFGLPNKFFEMMFAGLPIVVTQMRMRADLVKKMGLGVVVDPLNVENLAAGISKIHQNMEKYGLTDDQFQQMITDYGWPVQAEKLQNLYGQILGY